MNYIPYQTKTIDNFSTMRQSIALTSSKNIKTSTRKTYDAHIGGIYGWLPFLDQFNAKHNTTVPHLPTNDTIETYIEILILFIESRCVIGYSDELEIRTKQ